MSEQQKHFTLIACSASKLDRSAPAKDLYTGDLFQKSKAYAAKHSDGFFILSALHGLVAPDRQLEPYNWRMSSWRKSELPMWISRVINGVTSLIPAGAKITILAGKDYADQIELSLRKRGYDVERPLQGLGIGHQKQRLSQLTCEVSHAKTSM